MEISEAVNGFLLSLASEGYSPNTTRNYKQDLKILCAWLGVREVEAVHLVDLRAFMAYLRTEYKPMGPRGERIDHLSDHSLANFWTSVRSFFHWCYDEKLIAARPDTELKQPKFQRPVIEPFSQEEIQKLLDASEYTRVCKTERRQTFRMRRPTGERDKALIMLLLDTGLRISEAGRLTIADVSLETGEVAVKPWGSGQKTKSRHVYLGKATRKALWRYLASRKKADLAEPTDPLFMTEYKRAMDRDSARLVLRRIGERAGVVGVHPHKFRHTFAMQFLRNGGDVFTLQRMLGHSTLDMVRTYLALTRADVATAHAQASPVDRWRL